MRADGKAVVSAHLEMLRTTGRMAFSKTNNDHLRDLNRSTAGFHKVHCTQDCHDLRNITETFGLLYTESVDTYH